MEDLKGLTDEFMAGVLPMIRFLVFSEASTGNIFRTIRNELSDFMMNGAPRAAKVAMNKLSGILKPKYGFLRCQVKGVGLLEWRENHTRTPLAQDELMEYWKKIVPEKPAQKGKSPNARKRCQILREMVAIAGGWVPKSWLYQGFMELAGIGIGQEITASAEILEVVSASRPNRFNDVVAVREAMIQNQDDWRVFLQKSLACFSGRAEAIVFRLLLFEDSPSVAARMVGTSSQYAGRILRRISGLFSALLPLDTIEMVAFKCFLQEFLCARENCQ